MTEAEFAVAWREHFPRLFRYCQFRSPTLTDAEDLTAEAFARLLAQPAMPESRVLPWLYRVARNLAIDSARRGRHEAPLDPSAPHPAAPESPWRDPELWEAVRRLGGDQQLAVYLRLVEDRSFAEVGRLLGRSEPAAKMLYRRAIARLGEMLEVTQHAS